MCGGRTGIVLTLPSSAGMVSSRCRCPLSARSHSGVVLGKGAALLPGGSCWQRQLWLCVSSKSYNISCPSKLTTPSSSLLDPNLMALTPDLSPASLRAGSACEHAWVRMSSSCVCRPRPITLASTDVTGLEECKECGGAGAGVSILGQGQRGSD